MGKSKKTKFSICIEKDMCKSCRLCVKHCAFDCLEMSNQLNKRGVTFAKTKDNYQCTGCGACFFICPEVCIEINEE